MLDQLFGLLLFGLGLSNPVTSPNVKGESTEVTVETSLEESSSSEDESVELLITPKKSPKGVLEKTKKDQLQKENIIKREQELKNIFDKRKERLSEDLKKKREEAKEKYKEKREVFKENIEKIQDANKKAAVTKLDVKTQEINKKRTDQMTERLTHMSEILDKVGVRSSEAKASGKDVSAVDSRVSEARIAVSSAQTLVGTQAGKSYIAEVSSEEAVGKEFVATLQLLKTDLSTVHDSVKAAHTSVQKAVKALGEVL